MLNFNEADRIKRKLVTVTGKNELPQKITTATALETKGRSRQILLDFSY